MKYSDAVMSWIVLACLGVVLFTLVDPFMYWMPTMTQMIALTLTATLLLVYGGFVAAEKAQDERELSHRMQAGRAAFLAGISVLTIALCVQGLRHAIDPWIPCALFSMVLAKLAARIYSDERN